MNKLIIFAGAVGGFYFSFVMFRTETCFEGGGNLSRVLDAVCRIAGNEVAAFLCFLIAITCSYFFVRSLKS